jgi:hypothetical protein
VEYSKSQFACQLMDGQIQDDNFRVIDGIIYYKGRIFLVPESTFKAKILHACHNSPVAGNQGIGKTYRQVRERFSWKGLEENVMSHIKECTTCQKNKDEYIHPAGLLQPLPIPEHKWESIFLPLTPSAIVRSHHTYYFSSFSNSHHPPSSAPTILTTFHLSPAHPSHYTSSGIGLANYLRVVPCLVGRRG